MQEVERRQHKDIQWISETSAEMEVAEREFKWRSRRCSVKLSVNGRQQQQQQIFALIDAN